MFEYAQDPEKIRVDTANTYAVLIDVSHAHKIRSYYIQNEDKLNEFGIDVPYDFNTPQSWSTRIATFYEQHHAGTGYYFAVIERETENILGTMSLTEIRREPYNSCRFGFTYGNARPEYMQEVLDGIHDFMFDTVDLHRAELDWDVRNTTVPGMAKKFGFREVGVMHKYIKSGGEYRDHVLAEKINPRH